MEWSQVGKEDEVVPSDHKAMDKKVDRRHETKPDKKQTLLAAAADDTLYNKHFVCDTMELVR